MVELRPYKPDQPRKPRKILRRTLVFFLVVIVTFAAGAFGGFVFANERTGTQADEGSQISRTISDTEVRELNVVQYDGTLQDAYMLEKTVSGECSGASMAQQNPNAYRCNFSDDEGSFIADPCLAFSSGESVYCPNSPWDRNGVRIDLKESVEFDPNYFTTDEQSPWAIEIADPGNPDLLWRCRVRLGNTAMVSGNVPVFNCKRPDGTGDGQAFNGLDKSGGPVWTILFLDSDQPELIQAKVTKVWI